MKTIALVLTVCISLFLPLAVVALAFTYTN